METEKGNSVDEATMLIPAILLSVFFITSSGNGKRNSKQYCLELGKVIIIPNNKKAYYSE